MLHAIHPIPAFTDNYIWALIDDGAGQAAVVDPGDAIPVLEFLESRKLELTDVLVTHHHADHTGGLEELQRRYQPTVWGPTNPSISFITHPLSEQDTLRILGTEFRVLEVPGHTLDHIAFYADSEEPPVLFCGDTLFAAGCGRLFEGSPVTMHRSLGKLSRLPESTAVYCTHEYTLANLRFASMVEPDNEALAARLATERDKRDRSLPTLPSTIGLELQTNPFLRCHLDSIRSVAAQQMGETNLSEVDVFASVRAWKDRF